jgi:hypothetical protein
MGSMQFQIKIRSEGEGALCELAERLKDFSPAFANIIANWIRGNEAKFAIGVGQEGAGVSQGGDIFWEAIAPATRKSKRRRGKPDALMQDSGDLKNALTSDGGVAQYFDAHRAVFGTPLDADAEAHSNCNWLSRPTIFLNKSDRLSIRREIINYINFGDNYREIMTSQGLARKEMREEVAQMDVDFGEAVG